MTAPTQDGRDLELRQATFPQGHYYAVTWGIESQHGGMTSALMHRSRAFIREAGVAVTIVTYNHQEDLAEVVAELRQRGVMIDGMNVINLWDDLRSWDDDRLRAALATSKATEVKHFKPLNGRGNERTKFREMLNKGDNKDFEQADYFRTDGSLMVSHRKRVKDGEGVSVTFCDSDGRPMASFAGIRMVCRFWLDSLPKDPVAFMIIDSKTSANHYPAFRRADAITLYMVHGSHLADGEKAPHGRLSPGRANTFEQLTSFDGVVFLTERQRSDVQTALGPLDNLYVCSNSREYGHETRSDVTRDEKQGIAVGALVRGKRFNHAIKAVSFARKYGAFVKLNIYGRGPEAEGLKGTIKRGWVRRRVTLAGYTKTPEAEMARSSFLLMTSNREGFGLVLVEAMSNGCVPIAYDVDYGPSEIITDGVDGFLVEPGDFNALAKTIARFVKLPAAERQRMREAAVKRSLDFNDGAVVDKWAQIFTDALQRKTASINASISAAE